jgi:hypothetical protein
MPSATAQVESLLCATSVSISTLFSSGDVIDIPPTTSHLQRDEPGNDIVLSNKLRNGREETWREIQWNIRMLAKIRG